MATDIRLKEKQSYWETPKGLSTIVLATVAVVGLLTGIVTGLAGYKAGQSFGARPAPATYYQLPPGATIITPPAAPAAK